MLKMDALVTMLACLTTTTPPGELGGGTNTLDAMLYDNMTTGSCPISALSGLTTRLHNLANDIDGLKKQLGTLQEQLADLTRAGAGASGRGAPAAGVSIASRFLAPDINFRSADNNPIVTRSDFAPRPVPVPISNTPRSCLKQKHGVVRIQPAPEVQPFFVFCDEKFSDGGWILVANRYNGDMSFNHSWQDYKIGFGSVTTEFFIGLEKLHLITSSDNYELLVLIENRKQEQRLARYDQFNVGSESEKYKLNVLGKYEGDAGDALRQHVGKKFSTHDQDNDENPQHNCAQLQSGAWWYGDKCTLSNLFGVYQRLLERDLDDYRGILWQGFLNGPKGSLKVVRMLLRPKAL